MKAKIYVTNAAHHHQYATWLKSGFKRHGVEVEGPTGTFDANVDLVCMWGWRSVPMREEAKKRGVPILVLERGHLQPRTRFASMGFNGLGNLATYSNSHGRERFTETYGHQFKPWKENKGYVLIIGQVAGDASLHGLNIRRWEHWACKVYTGRGQRVVFRPHPLSQARSSPEGFDIDQSSSIEQALEGASLCVTYTSTSGVEAILSGVPVVTCHKGSMVRPVSSHGLLSKPVYPQREGWAEKLAWSQFSPDEIENGFAWENLRDAFTCIR